MSSKHIIASVILFCTISSVSAVPQLVPEEECVCAAVESAMPKHFQGTMPNRLKNESSLYPLYETIYRKQPIKVIILGDSHIKGDMLPQKFESIVCGSLDSKGEFLTITHYGVNGAWARAFCKEDIQKMVEEYSPDLVIISFGTNEAHNTTVNIDYIKRTYNRLVSGIQRRVKSHHCYFLLTTPPGSFKRESVVVRGVTKQESVPNFNNGHVATAISEYGAENKIAVWDLYNIIGGNANFGRNWEGYMQPDKVHYRKSGYEIQAQLFAEAFLGSYREYIAKAHPAKPKPATPAHDAQRKPQTQSQPSPDPAPSFFNHPIEWLKKMINSLNTQAK